MQALLDSTLGEHRYVGRAAHWSPNRRDLRSSDLKIHGLGLLNLQFERIMQLEE